MNTRYRLDKAIDELNESLFKISKLINEQIAQGLQAFSGQNLELANRVIEKDVTVNSLHFEIERECIRLLATQQPSGKDLRKIVASYKISIFLERMGDLAVDIAKTTVRLDGEKVDVPLAEIPCMGELIRGMIIKGLVAYHTESMEAALAMAKMDDEVDRLFNHTFSTTLQDMIDNANAKPDLLYPLISVISVGCYLMRIGDYCTNIAEEVHYIATAKRSTLNR